MTTKSSPSDTPWSDLSTLRRISNMLVDVQEERAATGLPFTKKQNHELDKALTAMRQLLLTYRGGSPHDAPTTGAKGL